MLDKNKETLDTHKAEVFLEVQHMKNDIMDKLEKNGKGYDEIQKNIEVLETKLQKANLSRGAKPMRSKLSDLIRNSDIQEKIQKWDSRKGSNDFSFDTPIIENQITIHDPTSFVAGDAPVVLPFREMGVDKPQTRPMLVSDLITWGTTTSNMVDWIERTAKTEGVGMRAEDGNMGQGDLTYTEKSTKVKIASQYMKATNESLKDADFLASEINDELLTDLRLLVDTQLLNGDGTGNNLLGIMPQATAFAAGSFATAVAAPNEADVLRIAINQVMTGGMGKFWPTAILLHPDVVTKLDLLKIADGRYIEVPYYDAGSATVVRVPVIQNVGIPATDFLVGDFTRAKAFLRDSLTIRVFDQNEDDPIHNRSTITSNIRLAFRIKSNDKKAFVTGKFAAAITAITKP
jgi:HK97 family phage major capsid protein